MFLLRTRLLRRGAGGGFDGSGGGGAVVVPSVVCRRRPGSSPLAAEMTTTTTTTKTTTTMRALVVGAAPRRRPHPLFPPSSSSLSSWSMSWSWSMHSSPVTIATIALPPSPVDFLPRRSFSTSGDEGGDDERKKEEEEVDVDVGVEENFFLNPPDDDDDHQQQPDFPPPSYVRDAVTGKWTDATRPELSKEDRRLLNLDYDTRGEEVMTRLGRRWTEASSTAAAAAAASSSSVGGMDGDGGDIDGLFGTINAEHVRVANRVRERRLALGPIGRDPADVVASTTPPGKGEYDARGEGAPLTSREYRALKAYAGKELGLSPKDFDRATGEDDDDLIPHNVLSSGSGGDGGFGGSGSDGGRPFDADLDLAYLDPRMHRRAFGRSGGSGGGDADAGGDPFADLLPSDLNPARKVNRRNAHPVPKRLLHHNNLGLLRRYTTPGGKIMNRVQSRLGAKDQRKIAKLVKRARHLGLVPHVGQWKFEDHGDVHVGDGGRRRGDATTTRDWEEELEKRGLWPLQDSTELVKRFYDMEKILEHIAGPKGGKKREELDGLLGGPGALVDG